MNEKVIDPRALEFADHMMRTLGRGPLPAKDARSEMDQTVPVRTFVCQGCRKLAQVLYGRSIICSCGTKSSAEVLKA